MSLLGALPNPDAFETSGTGIAPSAFAVTDLMCRSITAVGVELAAYMSATDLVPQPPVVCVDQRLATLWGKYSFRPQGWAMPDLWDDLAGIYQTRDGWIRLHTNLPHHRRAALAALNCNARRDDIADALQNQYAAQVEEAIHANVGVAAALRGSVDWANHPQGSAVAQEPLIAWRGARHIQPRALDMATPNRPLHGLRVLDLTRVLAGPIATRTLAGLGANVLRIDPPDWDEPGVIPDISLGKSMAALDLKSPEGCERLSQRLTQADVVVHGYRPGALDALGIDLARRDALAPNRVEVTLNAYGWTGPWANRRGFDSLVQMSSGIAHRGMTWAGAARPHPLPFQALDHATGYLMAAAALSGLRAAQSGQPVGHAHLSLARTAFELHNLQPDASGPDIRTWQDDDFSDTAEHTTWGPGQRLRSPLRVGQTQLQWEHPAVACDTHPADWR
ncbi:CoA transferase [Epibacterium ulvae]|uniref:CoA transferase n=1 Tax=Epibacterium ulvae TaxID=1156985 RepID=UPI001BFC820A|nr:CoA transferase [Epibacterium ulvae]MBT8153994.1 CoA transferase [Epibacterium ulvae]